MSRLRPILIVLAGLLLAGALTALVVREHQARAGGREVALTIQGVDPRDLLTGHYVAFSLVEPLREAEMCPVTLIGPAARQGWVALSPKGDPKDNHWQATGRAADRATAARLGVLTVKGSATCLPQEGHQIELDIGITRFHASQAQSEQIARDIPRWNSNGQAPAYALVSIGQDGHARLTGLLIAGHRIGLDW
ncbi:putative membrane-anchored protein [Caulobacter ginsengisoli]|uniref:Membrane-anchored protein n=1 Tax=Caulobacter ginsengisoli TaxID=400775 RepID=A0ABU0IQ95_9CAUL|nr:GDYXXLXY domain-containing protein [Caulobacter ginsengisoli]MDQ0464185.1 putative membrane-anchored protein [Caulobacter ginsengisoli]